MADTARRVRRARVVALVGWVVVVAVVIRVLSGGGTLRGVGYVLGTEAVVLVALLLASLVVSIIAILGFLRDRSWAWAVSSVGAGIALAMSVVLGLDGHDSAILAAAASGVVLLVGLRIGRVRQLDS